MNKEIEFISKLTKKTLRKEVDWKDLSSNILELPDGEKAISKVYTATIKDNRLRVYQYQYIQYIEYDESIWSQRIRLEMVDENGDRIYEFDYDYALNDLFNAITKANSGVSDFIDDFLAD